MCASAAAAQGQVSPNAPAAGTIAGIVTSLKGTIPLGGAVVTVRNTAGAQIAVVFTEGDGRFRVEHVPEGEYRVSVVIEGFTPLDATATVAAGAVAEVQFDLPIAAVSERVDVVADSPLASATLGSTETVTDLEREQFSPGGGVRAALRLLASVIQIQGGNSIKGGRPTQAGFQLDAVSLTDPASGLARFNLPDDAIDSVTVLPNPYAVEYGRFSSGLVVIRTRRGGDTWRVRLNNLDPTFRAKRGQEWNIKGIAAFGPRVEVGGPLVKDRLFLEQTAQYRYGASDVPSRPEDELRTTHWFSSFTRLDAALTDRHSIVGTFGVFPSTVKMASLGTFTPPDATVDTRDRMHQAALSARSVWSDALVAETAFQTHQYVNRLEGQGTLPMEILPDTTLGNYFNTQRRTTTTYQVLQSFSGTGMAWGGLHLYKLGVDVMRAEYRGTSTSRPVLIRRADGTLARRLDFLGPSRQEVLSTDVALFAQDRIQPTSRWFVEYGARVDRDGVLRRVNFTPRIGAAVLLNASGSSVLRGGYGMFFERTPSTVGAFEQFESHVDTRYLPDGATPIGSSRTVAHQRSGHLETPRSATWDLAFDHRFGGHWSIHAGWLDRRGSRELIIRPALDAAVPAYVLSSDGRSGYREVDFGVRYSRPPAADLDVSYARSQGRADLNAFTSFFDTMLRPLVGANEYAPAHTDVPNRLLVRGRLMPTPRWLVLGVADWRTGFPYSVVDEMLDFAEPRNSRRFPTKLRLELGLERRFRIFRWEPWIGLRASNALDTFLPTDVQANLGSPAFGTFYNSEYRQLRLQVRFSRY
jgi:hypothetical protein